jgi:hypothetical protein
MEKTDTETQPRQRQDERSPGVPPHPRGNPETDHKSVEKGEQQLEKISGN